MPDQQPEAHPADPFVPAYAGAVAVIENFRNYRAAGASLVEATCLTASLLFANHLAYPPRPSEQDHGEREH